MSEGYVEDERQVYEADTRGVPVPVRVLNLSEFSEKYTPEFGSTNTYAVPQNTGQNQPVQILPRRTRREKAWIIVEALANGATAVWINSKLDPLTNPTPTGIQITAVPFTLPWENQQPCYAIAVGGGPVNVAVLDQGYHQ